MHDTRVSKNANHESTNPTHCYEIFNTKEILKQHIHNYVDAKYKIQVICHCYISKNDET